MRRPHDPRPPLAFPVPDRESFFPVDSVHALVIHPPAFPAQQHMQPQVAEPPHQRQFLKPRPLRRVVSRCRRYRTPDRCTRTSRHPRRSPCRALRFWRLARLLPVRLRYQQRFTLDSNDQAGGPSEDRSLHWGFDRCGLVGEPSPAALDSTFTVGVRCGKAKAQGQLRTNPTLAISALFRKSSD